MTIKIEILRKRLNDKQTYKRQSQENSWNQVVIPFHAWYFWASVTQLVCFSHSSHWNTLDESHQFNPGWSTMENRSMTQAMPIKKSAKHSTVEQSMQLTWVAWQPSTFECTTERLSWTFSSSWNIRETCDFLVRLEKLQLLHFQRSFAVPSCTCLANVFSV